MKPIKSNQEKTRYSDEELKEFEALLHKKLDASRGELNYLQEQIRRLVDNPDNKMSSLEDGVGTLEKEYLNKMAARQAQYIKHLENALIRIKNKVYGVCRVTGRLIRKERLKAVPHATLSIDAKRMRK
ncbi:MAG: TraR/DksA family transcriptional regulator [Chitinophagales bacterium]